MQHLMLSYCTLHMLACPSGHEATRVKDSPAEREAPIICTVLQPSSTVLNSELIFHKQLGYHN